MERLTLRAEPGSWPLWDDADREQVDPEDYGLPADLLADLDTWTRRLDQVDGDFEDPDANAQFDVDGRALWQRLAEALRGRAELSWEATFSDDREAPPAS
jgi:hypothetical protein